MRAAFLAMTRFLFFVPVIASGRVGLCDGVKQSQSSCLVLTMLLWDCFVTRKIVLTDTDEGSVPRNDAFFIFCFVIASGRVGLCDGVKQSQSSCLVLTMLLCDCFVTQKIVLTDTDEGSVPRNDAFFIFCSRHCERTGWIV
jgi:hypothetical protein